MPEKWLFLLSETSHFLKYFLIVFNKTIIPLALVGYEMIIEKSALRASLAIKHLYPTRARGIIVKYLIYMATC